MQYTDTNALVAKIEFWLDEVQDVYGRKLRQQEFDTSTYIQYARGKVAAYREVLGLIRATSKEVQNGTHRASNRLYLGLSLCGAYDGNENPMSEKRIVAIDSQKLSALQSCMYAYGLQFGKNGGPGYTPLQTPDYFERGDLIHTMMAEYYSLRRFRSRWQQNGKTHADIVQSCITVGRHKAVKMELDIADVEESVHVFLQYTDFWENDGWDQVVGVEQVGAKVLYDSEDLLILYESKIDLMIKLDNYPVLPIDHKTTKSHRAPNELADQFKGYAWTLNCNNLLVNEVGFQKTKKPHEKFQRHLLSFPQDIIDEWVENSVWWVRHGLSLMDAGIYPHNYTSCDKFSGCIYKDLCTAERAVRDYKLHVGFKERTWDVGKEHL